MAHDSTKEGTVLFKIPSLDKPCSTYYKIVGDLNSGVAPLVMVHGGPCCAHGYFLPFAELWTRFGIPVVFYDQIGCGKSTRLDETAGDESLWREQLFLDELDNLVDHLHLRDGPGFSIYGHNWGGFIAPAYAASRPRGLQRLIIANGSASRDLCIQSYRALWASMPSEHEEAFLQAERTRDVNDPAFQSAFKYLNENHMCRTKTQPPEFMDAISNVIEVLPINETMFGKEPFFTGGGSFRDWTCISRLLQITAPTLVLNSEFDTNSRDVAQQPFFDNIPCVRWYQFADAGHMPWLESEALLEKSLTIISGFLAPSEHNGTA